MSDVIEGMEAVTVHIRDIAKARRFYTEVLGLKEISVQPEVPMAVYEIPGTTTRLRMHVQAEGEDGREPGTVSGVVFSHHDPAAASAEILRRGGTIVDPVHTFQRPFGTVILTVIADPDGNEFIIRHVQPPAPGTPGGERRA